MADQFTVSILMLFEKHRRSITSYSPNKLSIVDIKNNADLNIHYYALLEIVEIDPYSKKQVYIDLSWLMQEQLAGQANDWETFLSSLTLAMIDSYTINGAGIDLINNKFKQAVIIQPFTTLGLNLSYCDKNDPTVTDKFYKRWDLPDLVISKKEEFIQDVQDIKFENCICSVNGLITKPSVFEDKLYIADGAKNLWSIDKYHTPNITMVDVSQLGELTYLPLSKCILEYGGNDSFGNELYNYDIKIILPDEYSLNDYFIILTIAGKAYFIDELITPTEKTIMFSPYKSYLHTHLLQIYEAHADYIQNSEIIYPDITPVQYIANIGKNEMSENYDGIFLINNPSISLARQHLTSDIYWYTTSSLNRDGIIIRKNDRTWMDYTTLNFDNINIHHYPKYTQDMMRLTTTDYANRQGGIQVLRCNHKSDYFYHVRKSKYEIVYLTCA